MKTIKTTIFFIFICVILVAILPVNFIAAKSKNRTSLTTNKVLPLANEEAAAGFDNLTNGSVDQNTFKNLITTFNQVEAIPDGIGPVFNSQSCGECHSIPTVGGSSQITELRAGHFDGTNFIDHPGDSLIHSRAVDAFIVEQIMPGNEVRAFRLSLNLLGDGFIEAIDDADLIKIANEQPGKSNGRIKGQAISVPIVESPGVTRIGRFGWKDQHASLLSFSGDAYVNEMGITTPLFPVENLSNGRSISKYDPYPDPEEGDNDDIEAFTAFIRATKVPPRDSKIANTPDSQSGEKLFNDIGCAICHVTTFTTLPTNFVINNNFTIPPALGNKVFHPYSDFLLHDIGTGDGIVQNGGQDTRNKLRTAPLWGLRTRNRLMHDGNTVTFDDAIRRHAGEASDVIAAYKRLSKKQRNSILTFLSSL